MNYEIPASLSQRICANQRILQEIVLELEATGIAAYNHIRKSLLFNNNHLHSSILFPSLLGIITGYRLIPSMSS